MSFFEYILEMSRGEQLKCSSSGGGQGAALLTLALQSYCREIRRLESALPSLPVRCNDAKEGYTASHTRLVKIHVDL